MGIKELFSIILNDHLFDEVNLVELAKERNGLEIIVDLKSVKKNLMDYFCTIMTDITGNEELKNLRAEYDKFSLLIQQFHTEFDKNGIKLVWVDKISLPRDEHIDKSKLKQLKWVRDILRSESHNFNPDYIFKLYPTQIFLESLKEVGAEVLFVMDEYKYKFIANEYHKRESYAVMTCENLFLLFENIRVIFTQTLTYYYHHKIYELPYIQRGNMDKMIIPFYHFKIPVIHQRYVLNRLFNKRDSTQMIILSILGLLKFIPGYVPDFQRYLDRSHVEFNLNEIISIINDNNLTLETFLENDRIQSFIAEHPDFEKIVTQEINQFSLNFVPQNLSDDLETFLKHKMDANEMKVHLMNIYNGVFHETVFIEDPVMCNNHYLSDILAPLRQEVYPYLLDKKRSQVIEDLPHPDIDSVIIDVHHSSIKANEIHGFHEVLISKCENPGKCGALLFHQIVSHLESDTRNLFCEFDTEKAIILYLLRYFFLITNNSSLILSEDEFKSVFCSVIYQYRIFEDKEYLKDKIKKDLIFKFKIKPSTKCLIAFSWLTILFHYFKYIIGDTFSLRSGFPIFSQLLSISVFVAFYEKSTTDLKIGKHNIRKLDSAMDTIIENHELEFALVKRPNE